MSMVQSTNGERIRNCEFGSTDNCKNLSKKVDARSFFGIMSIGTITKLSESCICIDTDMCLPLGTVMEVFIHRRKNIISVPVSILGFNHRDSVLDTMSVGVLLPNREYAEFVATV